MKQIKPFSRITQRFHRAKRFIVFTQLRAGFTKRSDRSAFTLIETIVALALIVGALAGPFTLATRGIFSSKLSKNRLTALNLAEEGIELIRFYRDNNILTGSVAWDASLGSGAGTITRWIADVYCDPGALCTPATGKARSWQQCITDPCSLALRIDSEGLYSYLGSSASIYTRTITIDRNFAEGDAPLPGVSPADRMQVISKVTWTDSGIARQVQVEDVLYNWQ